MTLPGGTMATDMMFLPTAIGSLPHKDAEAAVDLVLDSIPQCPHWPQLPNLGLRQRMEIQFTEGFPGAVIDEANARLFFDTSDEEKCAEELSAFYEKYMNAQESDNWSVFAMSDRYAPGISLLESEMSRRAIRPSWLKVQITGPLTIGLCCKDEKNRPIYLNEGFRDSIVKGLAAKARWQIDTFKDYCDNLICFIDEPMLYKFDVSSEEPFPYEDGVAAVAEIAEAVHGAGALCGVHCCGKAPWTIAMDAGVDILSFDAITFGDSMLAYANELKAFLENDNYLAWGIVPTSDRITEDTVGPLIAKYDEIVGMLAGQGLDKNMIFKQTILTPSCGTGTLSVASARHVYETVRTLSAALKERGL